MPRLLMMACFVALAGCNGESPTSPAAVPVAPKEVDPFPRSDVTLEEVDCAGFLAAVAKHPGKVVLVDVWGDFCLPCKQRFPHIVEMQKKYGKDGLVVVSLALDSVSMQELPTTVRGPVLEFLKRMDA